MTLVVYLIQWMLYLVAMVFFIAYSLLRFISKPGTRFIWPVILIGAAVLYGRPFLHHVFDVPMTFDSLGPITLDGLIVVAIFIFGWAYVYLSRGINLVLGVFPPITRPLPPVKKIAAPKATNMQPAAVRIVVPPLPRTRQ